jgi:opacity protein-like surface antigen
MTTKYSSMLVGAAFLCASATAACAADLGGLRHGGMMGAPMTATWYLRGDTGYTAFDSPHMVESGIYDLVDTDIAGSWTIGGGVGRYFTQNIRGDITVDYNFEADVSAINADPAAPFGGNGTRSFGLESTIVLANLYYDFDAGSRFSPYLGVGLGFVHHRTKTGTAFGCGCTGEIEGASATDVAAALMAGFTVNFGYHQPTLGSIKDGMGSLKDGPVMVSRAHRFHLDVGYRFLYLGKAETGIIRDLSGLGPNANPTEIHEIHAHQLRIGLRYDIM